MERMDAEHGAKPYFEDVRAGIVIWHGDCREVLPRLDLTQVAVVLTDPPYGIRHTSGRGASWAGTYIAGDEDTTIRDEILAMLAEKPALVFGTWKTKSPQATHTALVWDKGPAFGMGNLSIPWKPSWEMIYVVGFGFVGRRDEGVLRDCGGVSWESRGRAHPHEKPVRLLIALLQKSPSGLVLDPFAGSGTTGRACKDLGRKCWMIEKEEKYCECAANRLSQEVLDLGASA